MDIINGYVLAIIIIITLSIVIIYLYNKKKSHIPQLRNIARLSARLGFRIYDRDIINEQFIGIDPVKKVLLLSHLDQAEEPVKMLQLSDITFCRIEKESRDIVHRGRNRTIGEKVLVRISLVLYSSEKNPEAEFVFFDETLNKTSQMPYLLKKAEYWKNKITGQGNINILSPVQK